MWNVDINLKPRFLINIVPSPSTALVTSFQVLDVLDIGSFKCIFQVALELKFLSAA